MVRVHVEPLTNFNIMNKQELAQKRNWLKFQLAGSTYPVDKRIFTPEELKLYEDMMSIRLSILNNFNKNSRDLGLKTKKL